MSKNLDLLQSLFEKYTTGKATPEETRQLFAIIAGEEYDEAIKAKLLEQLENTDLEQTDVTERWGNVFARIKEETTWLKDGEENNKKRSYKWLGIAASLLIFSAIGIYVYQHSGMKQNAVTQLVKNDVLPGGNKAYLTLGNGQRISLSDAKNGTIANQAGGTVQKTAEGLLVYEDGHSGHGQAENIYNTIETPRGGQYQVVLPDGSKVWLNAASSLKYPATFTGTDRKVELTGEAYFEVAKDKAHPFKVQTNNQEVEVLGTHFDINSYPDEPAVATTLLEGSVKVTSGSKQRLISPGEQVLNDGQRLNIDKPNIDNITDWKDGDFNLEGLDFRVAMRKIARWYNVEVVYDPSLPDGVKTGGWVSRNRKLSTVLNGIAHSSQFKFKVEGGKVYVSK